MLWEWVGLGLVLLMTRQLVVQPAEARAVAAMLVALGVCVAAYALYDCHVEMPRKQAAYKADPDAVLKANDVDDPPGSPQRKRFEVRLADRQPLGTFGLTNSLAAFLIVPLTAGAVMVLGACAGGGPVDGRGPLLPAGGLAHRRHARFDAQPQCVCGGGGGPGPGLVDAAAAPCGGGGGPRPASSR